MIANQKHWSDRSYDTLFCRCTAFHHPSSQTNCTIKLSQNYIPEPNRNVLTFLHLSLLSKITYWAPLEMLLLTHFDRHQQPKKQKKSSKFNSIQFILIPIHFLYSFTSPHVIKFSKILCIHVFCMYVCICMNSFDGSMYRRIACVCFFVSWGFQFCFKIFVGVCRRMNCKHFVVAKFSKPKRESICRK
jgi:hypothetical protein